MYKNINLIKFIHTFQCFQEVLLSSSGKLCTSNCLREDQDVDKLVQFGIKEEKSSKAMRAYLERSEAYSKYTVVIYLLYRTVWHSPSSNMWLKKFKKK